MRRRLSIIAKIGAVAFMLWMWVFAFLLAPRESANDVKDREWSARSEDACKKAKLSRAALMDLTRIDPKDPRAVMEKGRIVDAATDTIRDAIDSIAADSPATAKGKELAPEWISDYRTYIQDRRDYAGELLKGNLIEFAESQVEGIPISERLGKFARENKMPSCQPPSDLQA